MIDISNYLEVSRIEKARGVGVTSHKEVSLPILKPNNVIYMETRLPNIGRSTYKGRKYV